MPAFFDGHRIIDVDSFNGGLPYKADIDLTNSKYDQNTWYPVQLNESYGEIGSWNVLDVIQQRKVEIVLPFSQIYFSWGDHSNNDKGKNAYAHFLAEFMTDGWDTRNKDQNYGYIFDDNFNFVKDNKGPIKFKLLDKNNGAIAYLRGGGKYYISSNLSFNVIIWDKEATSNGESWEPKSDTPANDSRLLDLTILKSGG